MVTTGRILQLYTVIFISSESSPIVYFTRSYNLTDLFQISVLGYDVIATAAISETCAAVHWERL